MSEDVKKTMGHFARRAIEEVFEVAGGIVIGALGHFFLTEKIGDKVRYTGLDTDKIRAHAPFFVQSLADEAKFNELIIKLDPGGLQKGLEIWMANLGRNQRSDLILTIVQMPDDKAEIALHQLAEVTPDVFKTRRAVAFKLMKASEDEYLGAQLTEQASAALVAAIAEFRQGKVEWDIWARDAAADVRVHRQELEADHAVRRQVVATGSRWQRMVQAHHRATAFPWERN